MIPRSWRPETQAAIWWREEYDRHTDAGFSDADSRLRCWEIARATPALPLRLRLAEKRRHE